MTSADDTDTAVLPLVLVRRTPRLRPDVVMGTRRVTAAAPHPAALSPVPGQAVSDATTPAAPVTASAGPVQTASAPATSGPRSPASASPPAIGPVVWLGAGGAGVVALGLIAALLHLTRRRTATPRARHARRR